MSTFQFVWQVLAICGLVTIGVYGLVSAPWYVLATLLVLALVMIYRLMPSNHAQDWQITTFSDTNNHNRTSSQADLVYRGAHYPTASPSTQGDTQVKKLFYRGAAYATPILEADVQQDAIEQTASVELKYRGAKTKFGTQ